MTIIKCKMCGGDIQRNEDQAYGTCDSCGSTMTFPKVSDEQRANLFNRANHFRRQGEFDKAIAAYESILNQDDADAEAHWGVVLSRYGIEYVEDPISHERVPTCHRVQMESILNDADYLAALEHASDSYSRGLYEEEAKRIAELQRGILALSAQEKPYDVFICYKETTDSGTRTPDSALAQEVYYQLTGEGYKVFFSRITLEDKLGQQYEPYIFAALNSARVMVVIGTQAEYFNAVWVKNEWSRFLTLMKKDRSKLLIPCYKGMDAYDLPEALSMLQSQDMGKIGFIQDLVRGIKKVVDAGRAKPGAEAISKPVETIAAPGVQSLMRRAQLFLEDGDFKSATEYAEKVLDIDPEHSPAYMARLQASLSLRNETELGNSIEPLEGHGDYQKAVRFADARLKPVYLGHNQRILDRLEEERKEGIYQAASKQYKGAYSEADYLLVSQTFQSLGGYKDADERALTCQAKADEAHVAKLVREEADRAERSRLEAERARKAEQERLAEEKRRAKNKRLAMIITPIVAAAIAIVLLITQVVIPRSNYQKAMNLLSDKQYDQAAEAFTALGSYSDSADKVKESAYQKAKALQGSGRFDAAIQLFEGLGNYRDASSIVSQAQGDKLYAAGDISGAYTLYAALDPAYRTHDAEYAQMYSAAMQMLQEGKHAEAGTAFSKLGSYTDAAVRVKQAQADKLYAAGDYIGAYTIYKDLDVTYQTHSADYQAMYDSAAGLLAEGSYDESIAGFEGISNYSDAGAQAVEALYLKGKSLLSAGQYDEATTVFNGLGIYKDAASLANQAQADKLYAAGDYIGAYTIYKDLDVTYQTHSADYQAMYDAATSALAEGDFNAAIEAFLEIVNYADSADKLTLTRYRYAAALVEKGDDAEAEAMYSLIPDYSDVPGLLHGLRLRIADKAFEAKEYERALELYLKLPQTEELKSREYALAQACYDEGAFGVATQAYELLGQYELSLSRLPVARYAWAAQLFEQGQYLLAAEQFTLLGGMTDSAERAKASLYQHGMQLLSTESYEEAKAVFVGLSGYKDADTLAQEADYRKAAALMEAGDYAASGDLFQALGEYRDSRTQRDGSRYELAEAARIKGSYAKAEEMYRALGTYSDSAEKMKLCIFNQAEALLQAGDYAAAEKKYAGILDYEDSAEKMKQCRLEQGRALYAARDWRGALKFVKGLGHGDSGVLAAECYYELGDAALKAGRTDEAVGEYALATVLPKAQERLYSLGKDYAAVNQHEKAIQALWAAGDHQPSQTLLEEIGSLLEQGGKKELTFLAYALLDGENEAAQNTRRLAPGISQAALRQALKAFNILPQELAIDNECMYRYGKALAAEAKYTEAAAVLIQIKDYKDVASLIAADAGLSSAAAAAELERKFTVGNTVTFGKYEQDNNTANGKEPIVWRVLQREGTKALVISEKILDCQPYNKEWTSITWEKSTLRPWLNGTFSNAAFSAEEQKAILTTTLKNEDNPEYKTDGGNPTQDRVFLLSIAEAETLFRDDASRVAKNTAYAKTQGAYDNSGAGLWWLRSPGFYGNYAAIVLTGGSVYRYGSNVDYGRRAVRPALWLDLTSDIFSSVAP